MSTFSYPSQGLGPNQRQRQFTGLQTAKAGLDSLQSQWTKVLIIFARSIYFRYYIMYILPQIRVIIDRQEMAEKGNFDNPIDLNDEEFEYNKIADDKLEEARNRAILDEAKISGSQTEICLAVVKTMIPGQSSIKSKIVKRQIIDYFYKTINIKIHCQHFNSRQEPDYSDPSTQPDPCQLILYGVDFLTTAMILNRFTMVDAAIKQIKWIDDSSCKLVYGSAQETEKAIQSQLMDVDGWKIKQQQNNNNQSREWFSLRPYWIHSFERPLKMRYATNREGNMQKCSLAKYDQYQKADQELYQHLLFSFHAVDKYIKIMQQLQIQNKLINRNHRNYGITNRARRNNLISDKANLKDGRKDNKSKIITKHYQSNGFKSLHRKQATRIRYEHIPSHMVQSDQLPRRIQEQDDNDLSPNRQELNFQQKHKNFSDTDELEPNLSFEPHKDNDASHQEDEQDRNINLSMNSVLWSFRQEKPSLNCDLSFTKKIQQDKNQVRKEDGEFELNFQQLVGEKNANSVTFPQENDLCFSYKQVNYRQEISESNSFYRTTSNQSKKKERSQLNVFNSYKKKEMSKNSIPLDISSDQSERY